MTTENQGTIPLLLPERLAGLSGVQFFFTTRWGGVSQGSYASLNLGGHVGDDPAAVASNRARLQSVWGERVRGTGYLNQVHGSRTVELNADLPRTPPDADAWVTRQPGLVLAVLTADCAPVLLADAAAGVIGAAHAGWRGGLSGILESCLDAMQHLGARRERTHAVIGPCIRQDSYVVNDDFYANFAAQTDKIAFGYKKFFSKQNNDARLRFDLPGYLRERLRIYGLLEERIHDVELCTCSEDKEFFSHRRTMQRGGAACGRQAGGVFLVR